MSKEYRKVAVLMGGVSAEREVSLRSGQAVARGLRGAGYEVVEVDITAPGLDGMPTDADAAFVALHGEFGEDGQVQRLLADMGIAYTGSDPSASEAAFDKRRTKQILTTARIPTPAYEILHPGQPCALPLPVVVKPLCQGSSIGIHRVLEEAQWPERVEDAFRFGAEVMVEAYIPGRELTVGVVGEQVLPVVEIHAPQDWYDYRAKYTPGLTSYIVPADLAPGVRARCQEAAWRTFQALGCRGFARIDLRLAESGNPYVLELNSIPGFTETSLLPKAAAAAGLSFTDLCDRILRLAAI